MKIHEFYKKYANTPISDRSKPLNFNKAGLMTLWDIYKEVKKLEDEMRPHRIELEKHLDLADEYYGRSSKNN